MRRGLLVSLFLLILIVIAASAAASRQRVYHLSIGDPARRDREVPVVLDGIVVAATGQTITPDELPAHLEGTQLLLLGETHTSIDAHRIQLRVVRALHEAGRSVLIGLEMFPYTEQRFLDDWSAGRFTEEEFLRQARWYEHWGYHWHYYRDVFLFARDRDLPMHAVNVPREVVAAVRRKGLTNLTPEEAAHVPPGIAVDDADHMTFFRASFEDSDTLHGGLSEEAWRNMLNAQATWDASMGHHAVQALRKASSRRPIMVVLVGSGHVAYGVGIERQARAWFDGGIASLVPVPVRDADDEPVTRVRASYASFVWGVPAERDGLYPSLGISTRAAEGSSGARQVIQVEKDSVAERAGFLIGDVVLSMDGTAVGDRETLNRLMASKSWGDASTFVVRRGADEKRITTYFRRTK